MVDGISGVKGTGGEQIGAGRAEDLGELAELLRQAGNRDEVEKVLEEELGLNGIQILIEGSDIAAQEFRRQLATQPGVDPDEIIDEEIQDLLEVEDQTDLLREIAGRVAVQNQRGQEIIDELRGQEQTYESNQRLVFKDVDSIEFDQSEKARDLIEEDDLTTTQIKVKADAQNGDPLYIGGENVSVGNGFELEAGSEETIPIDVNLQVLKIVSQNTGDKYTYMAFGVDN